MPSRQTVHPASRQPGLTALLFLISLTMAGILAIGALVWTQWAALAGWRQKPTSIVDAESVQWVPAAALIGVAALALLWVIVWRVMRWKKTPLLLIPLAIAIVSLITALLLASGIIDRHNEFAVETSICKGSQYDAAPGRTSLPDCTPLDSNPIFALGVGSDPERYTRDLTLSREPSRTPDDLPAGQYDARFQITLPASVGQVEVARLTDGKVQSFAMKPGDASGPDGRIWYGLVEIGRHSDWQVLAYESTTDALPGQTIAFSVLSCPDTSLANFDPSGCVPSNETAPLLTEDVPDGTVNRPAIITQENGGIVISNLEAREYTFVPTQAELGSVGDRRDYVVKRTERGVASGDNLLQLNADTGQEELTIAMDASAGSPTYVLYVLPQQETFANMLSLRDLLAAPLPGTSRRISA